MVEHVSRMFKVLGSVTQLCKKNSTSVSYLVLLMAVLHTFGTSPPDPRIQLMPKCQAHFSSEDSVNHSMQGVRGCSALPSCRTDSDYALPDIAPFNI